MNRLKDFFFAPTSPMPLVVLRISVAVVLLIQALFIAPEILDLYGRNGLFQSGLSSYLLNQKLPFFVGTPTDAVIRMLFLTYVGALAFLATGYHTRVAAVLAWFSHFIIKINLGYLSSYGVDTFALIFLFYFIWMPVHGRESQWTRFSLRVLQAHLFIIYCSSGIAKIAGYQWRNGEVIWRAAMMPQFSVFDMSWLASFPLIALVIAWSTLAIEIGYPILLGVPKLRFWGGLSVLAMHLGIACLMGLWSFGLFMMVLTASCFLVPSELRLQPQPVTT